MPAKTDLADAFLREIEGHGENLCFTWESQKIVLKKDKEVRRVPGWRLDLMIFSSQRRTAPLTRRACLRWLTKCSRESCN
jgi:hypothetical protein